MPETPETETPQTWAEFQQFRPSFDDIIAKWRFHLLNLLKRTIECKTRRDNDRVGHLIIGFILPSINDLDDLMLLIVRDRHRGAHRILRTIYERVVTLKYIAQNPTLAADFMEYDAIDWSQVMMGVEETSGLALSEPAKTNLSTAAAEARKKFKGETCPECGLRKQTSWTKLSSKAMADRVGLGHMHYFAFVEPSKLIHPTYWGINNVVSERSPLYNTLNYFHELLVHLVLLHRRHFSQATQPTPMMWSAVHDFLNVWVFAVTSFDGMLDGYVRRKAPNSSE